MSLSCGAGQAPNLQEWVSARRPNLRPCEELKRDYLSLVYSRAGVANKSQSNLSTRAAVNAVSSKFIRVSLFRPPSVRLSWTSICRYHARHPKFSSLGESGPIWILPCCLSTLSTAGSSPFTFAGRISTGLNTVLLFPILLSPFQHNEAPHSNRPHAWFHWPYPWPWPIPCSGQSGFWCIWKSVSCFRHLCEFT